MCVSGCVCVYTHVILVTLYLSLIHNVTCTLHMVSLRIHGYTSMTYTTCAFGICCPTAVWCHTYVGWAKYLVWSRLDSPLLSPLPERGLSAGDQDDSLSLKEPDFLRTLILYHIYRTFICMYVYIYRLYSESMEICVKTLLRA